jgi:hypothetical protein
MEEKAPQQEIKFNLNPDNVPVLYIDSYLIGSNEEVVTFNFGQANPDPSQQTIVSRVAMTTKQAREFLKNLDDHIQKYEV